MNLINVDEFSGRIRMLYTALRLDYRLRLWAPISASRAVSAIAKLLVTLCHLLACETNADFGFQAH